MRHGKTRMQGTRMEKGKRGPASGTWSSTTNGPRRGGGGCVVGGVRKCEGGKSPERDDKTITPPGYSVLVAPCKLAAFTGLEQGTKGPGSAGGSPSGPHAASLQVRIAARPAFLGTRPRYPFSTTTSSTSPGLEIPTPYEPSPPTISATAATRLAVLRRSPETAK